MGSGLAALMGLLHGTEGLPEGMITADKQRLAEGQLAEQKRQFDEAKMTDFDALPGPLRDVLGVPDISGKAPTALLPSILKSGEKKAESARVANEGRALAAGIPNTEDKVAPRTDAMDLNANPEAAGIFPAVTPANPQLRALKNLLESGQASEKTIGMAHDAIFGPKTQ